MLNILFRHNCFLIILSICFTGCATWEVEDEALLPVAEEQVPHEVIVHKQPDGVYHKVRKGETIWRISKAYNVTIDQIISANNIPDVAQLEVNQLILIPGAYLAQIIEEPQEAITDDFIWPIKGKVVRYFNDRSTGRINKGVDIKAQVDAFVKASRTGRVVFADYLVGYGQTVILDHNDGFYSVYANNEQLLVKLNQNVKQHTKISKVASTGQSAYLHFEIRRNAVEDNPLFYLP